MGMGIIRKMRRQKAVYWGTPTSDGRGGTQTVNPIEIDCRWASKRELIRTASGEEIVTMSKVYTDQDVDEGGFLYLGTLVSLGDDTDINPEQVDGAFEIRRFEKTPVLKVREDGLDPNADEYLRTVWL